MHKTLVNLVDELEAIAQTVADSFGSDEPLSIAHANWSFPGLTGTELMEMAISLVEMISDRGSDETTLVNEEGVKSYIKRLAFLRSSTIPNTWANAGAGVSAYVLTLDGLRRLLDRALPSTAQQDLATALRTATRQVRAMEARISSLADRSNDLEGMVERIEKAHESADQLPTDLHSLKEARVEVDKLLRGAESDRAHILAARASSDELVGSLTLQSKQAEAVLNKCDTAYASATSQGLAGAFADRSKTLDTSMWIWVGGLVASLVVGGVVGSAQLKNLADAINSTSASQFALGVQLILSILSVGAPVWFAWLSTKQIGQRFRISEDYAFKASVSKAYEGYRREAARIDEDLETQLLSSALNRLDEQPLRLVEPASYGSPWHELLASDVVKNAAQSVPDFASKVVRMAKDSLDNLHPRKVPPAANTPIAAVKVTPEAEDVSKG
ncbi:hypothetical protein [Pseudomonas sp. MWU13-3659]|uniref:hypothetical protein n=1 Tax=Pseudomonas sp. MWU13-3659 TaxID=2986964 RepID=UPI00207623C6